MSAPAEPTDPRCSSGKTRYRTWRHAEYDARAMRRHKGGRYRNEHAYSCSSCSGFHVGSSAGRVTKKKGKDE